MQTAIRNVTIVLNFIVCTNVENVLIPINHQKTILNKFLHIKNLLHVKYFRYFAVMTNGNPTKQKRLPSD